MKKALIAVLCVCLLVCAAFSLAEESTAGIYSAEITDGMRTPETTGDDSILLKVWNRSGLEISYLRIAYYAGDECRGLTVSCPDEGEDFYRSPYSPETPEELKDLRIECSYGISALPPEDAVLRLMTGEPAEEHPVDVAPAADLTLECGKVYHLVLAMENGAPALMVIPDSGPDPAAGQGGPSGGFTYVHDPRENAAAMADIIENPDAVYGFSPDPASTRLGPYADYDWTDPAFVAKAREERRAYHETMDSMTDILYRMRAEGASMTEMARAVSVERNRLRLASYQDDPEGLANVMESNLKTYGHEDGPTPDQLFEKYGSWTAVMQKAFSSNLGMDACCGLYDEYYWLYIELGYVTE